MERFKSRFFLGSILGLVLGWTFSFFYYTKSIHIDDKIEAKTESAKIAHNTSSSDHNIPDYALETLEYIREHKEAPNGYVGGRTFQNRESLLPKQNESNQKIQYKEWDVHPKVQGQNRGAERIVTSDQGEAYFTSDHYQSFKKIN